MNTCQHATVAKFVTPPYSPIYFETIEMFNEYVTSPDYNKDSDHKGICFGIEQFADPNQVEGEETRNYTFGLHYPDQKAISDRLGKG